MREKEISWRQALREALETPPPQGKSIFLKRVALWPREEPFSIWQVLYMQVGYIRCRVWLCSLLLVGFAIFVGSFVPEEAVWLVSALSPVLSLSVLMESYRSLRFHMAELELSTRLSLRSVLLSRLFVLGSAHLVLLWLVLPLCLRSAAWGVFRTGVCVVTPFLITTAAGLAIFRHHRSAEMPWLWVTVALFVGLLMWGLHTHCPQVYQWTAVWTCAASALTLLCAGQIWRIQKVEDTLWI